MTWCWASGKYIKLMFIFPNIASKQTFFSNLLNIKHCIGKAYLAGHAVCKIIWYIWICLLFSIESSSVGCHLYTVSFIVKFDEVSQSKPLPSLTCYTSFILLGCKIDLKLNKFFLLWTTKKNKKYKPI